MNDSFSPTARLEQTLSDPSRGVLGFVDDLLAASDRRELLLDWRDGLCRLSFPGDGPAEQIEVPLPKSVVRAALARLAALCNEHSPNSVSPYGGEAELALGESSARGIRVAFVNTPEEQSARLSPTRLGAALREPGSPRVNGSTVDVRGKLLLIEDEHNERWGIGLLTRDDCDDR